MHQSCIKVKEMERDTDLDGCSRECMRDWLQMEAECDFESSSPLHLRKSMREGERGEKTAQRRRPVHSVSLHEQGVLNQAS